MHLKQNKQNRQRSTNYTKMKDNGIDMDSAVPVVYIPLHEGTAPFIDMPLDFIFA